MVCQLSSCIIALKIPYHLLHLHHTTRQGPNEINPWASAVSSKPPQGPFHWTQHSTTLGQTNDSALRTTTLLPVHANHDYILFFWTHRLLDMITDWGDATNNRERNINYFTAPIERGTQFIAPPVERTVKRIDNRLPLEKMARGADQRIKRSIDRVGTAASKWPGAKRN